MSYRKTFCEIIKTTGRKVAWKTLNDGNLSVKYLLQPAKRLYIVRSQSSKWKLVYFTEIWY